MTKKNREMNRKKGGKVSVKGKTGVGKREELVGGKEEHKTLSGSRQAPSRAESRGV